MIWLYIHPLSLPFFKNSPIQTDEVSAGKLFVVAMPASLIKSWQWGWPRKILKPVISFRSSPQARIVFSTMRISTIVTPFVPTFVQLQWQNEHVHIWTNAWPLANPLMGGITIDGGFDNNRFLIVLSGVSLATTLRLGYNNCCLTNRWEQQCHKDLHRTQFTFHAGFHPKKVFSPNKLDKLDDCSTNLNSVQKKSCLENIC